VEDDRDAEPRALERGLAPGQAAADDPDPGHDASGFFADFFFAAL
jgi:hypothetical protein